MELYRKHRPKNLDQLVGQDTIVNTLKRMAENDSIPHAILITGPSGCGKTTLARIIRRLLRCNRFDFIEDAPRKVEDIRSIGRRMGQAPLKGKCRVWLIDECHKLTSDSQEEFLKMLEDTPEHVYFILTTTDPQKLKTTLKNRCTEFVVKSLGDDDIENVIEEVCKKEETSITGKVMNKIVENSDGSARKALVFLNSIINQTCERDMLNAIVTATAETQAFAIVRALLYKPGTKWREMAKILKETEGEEPEQIRWLVLACAKTEMLKGGKLTGRAFIIIDAFRDNFYDSKIAGLCAACWEVVEGNKNNK